MKFKQTFYNVSLTISALILTLLLMEVGLSLLNLYGRYSQQKLFSPSPIPGLPKIATANLNDKNFFTNSHHLRDTEITLEKPTNTYRVAIVGNSVTIGHGVPQTLLFTELIEEYFNNLFEDNPKVDIINAGQIQFNINHFLPYTKGLIYQYNPDLIVYQFNWNDIAVSTRFKGRNIAPDQLPEGGLKRFLLKRSKIYRNLYRFRDAFEFRESFIKLYENPELLHQFYSYLFSWAEDVKTHEIEFFMFTVPWALETQAAERFPEIIQKCTDRKNEIMKVCDKNGISVFDLSTAFRKNYLENKAKLFIDQGHLNEKGHALVAELMQPFLFEYIIPTDSTAIKQSVQ